MSCHSAWNGRCGGDSAARLVFLLALAVAAGCTEPADQAAVFAPKPPPNPRETATVKLDKAFNGTKPLYESVDREIRSAHDYWKKAMPLVEEKHDKV